jgi:hypothetical protein
MGGSSTDFSSSSSYDFSSSSNVTRRSARDYARADNREYQAPSSSKLPSMKGKDISSDSPLTLAVILDQTGSMQQIPALFMQKMSTLYAEANAAIQGKDPKDLAKGNTLEDKLDIAVVAIGDERNGESTPFQVLPYCHGADLVKGVLNIFPEGKGGGNCKESYDLGAYYLLNHSETPAVPKKSKPLLIILGDEGFYENISKSEIKQYIGDDLPKDLKTVDVMKALAQKFDAYIIRPEVSSYGAGQYKEVQEQWEEVFGPQRVLKMDSYDRVVDCMIGICGYASNNFKVSEDLLRRRQTPAQVDEVLKTLHPLLSNDKPKKGGKK